MLNLESLLDRLSRWDEDQLARLLSVRPDLLHQAPGDLTVLAIRMSSETSIRAHLQRLDAPALRLLSTLTRDAAAQTPTPASEVDPETAASLETAGLIFAAEEPSTTPSTWETPARMPHILDSLQAQLPQLPALLQLDPPVQGTDTVSAAMVENASLSVISDLLDDVAELLGLLDHSPAATLRTGGVGMRELRRIVAQSTRWGAAPGARGGAFEPGLGASVGSDASVGEIGWLLELTASCGLIELNDSQAWAPGRLAEQWSTAAREHQHQLLVSGWLIAPRAPMLLRGPHPTSRIAPTLALDRQRGDAEALRRVLLQTARDLIPDAAAPRRQLYVLNLPEDDLPGADALRGTLLQRLGWDRPLLRARVGHLLPWLVREAERLGLFAVGTLSTTGLALLDSGSSAEASEGAASGTPWAAGLAHLALQLGRSLPSQVDTILVQSDLTAIATGSLSAPSATALSDFAQREGHGAVPTFRFSTESLHRGLARGWSAASMLSWLQTHSLTPLPSSLSTQITDAARSWRGVQIAPAGAWLRVTDAEQRDALMQHPELSGLGLHVLGEDVLVCEVGPAALEQALTMAGFNSARTANSAPTQSRDSGAPMLGSSPEHTASWTLEASPWEHSRVTSPHQRAPDAEEVAAAAAALRRAGLAAPSSDSSVASDVIGTLRSALAGRRSVTLTRVSPQGSTHHVTGVPTGMNAGRVRIRVREDEGEAVVMLHRIAAVEESDVHHRHEGDR
nr:helicase-associated domain-containing protein [Nesterenkonia sp. Act20]